MSSSNRPCLPRSRRWRALARLGPVRSLHCSVAGLSALSLGLFALAAPAAQASQRSAARTAATYPYNFSRIAWTGSEEVIAATDSHGDLYYFWQKSGTTTWHKQLVAGATSKLVYSKPSIAVSATTVWIAAADTAGDLYYFTKTGTAAWHQVLLATGGSGGKYQAPSVTVGGGSVLISVGNTGGQLDTFTQPVGGSGWAEQTAATGVFGPSSITTVFAHDSYYLGLLTASSGGTLDFFWEELAAPGWQEETVAAPSRTGGYAGGSITASSTDVVITAAAATTGTVASFTQPIGGSTWTPEDVTTTGSYTSPQIALTGSVDGVSYDVITAANHAGALHYWWKDDGSSGSWTAETVAANGASAVYANPGIAITGTSVVITAINTKPGDVMYWSQAFQTSPWHKQVVATG